MEGTPEPVLVIHGVAMRNPDAFATTVRDFETRVNGVGDGRRTFRFIPVFWGDLAPHFVGLGCAVPPPAPCEPSVARAQPREETGRASAPAPGIDLPGAIGGIVDRLAAFGPFEDWAERQTSAVRHAVLPGASEGLGDLFVYVDRYEPIHQRVRDILAQVGDGWGTPEKPISILGHSLGGIIAFDAARSTPSPISIKRFVTFGSQSAVLHILDPNREVLSVRAAMQGLPPFNGRDKVRLPPTIGTWLSVWHAMDPLAFLAGTVFELHDGSPVVDERIEGQEGRWSNAHSCYWTHTEMVRLASGALQS
jgi:hypothetical protein